MEDKLIDIHSAWNEKHNRDGESKRIEGPTPNGGDYAIAYYYDKNDNPCKRQGAFLMVIVEYKSNGEYVNSTTAFLQ